MLSHLELRDLIGLTRAEQELAIEAFIDRWRALVDGRRAMLVLDEHRGRVLVLRAATDQAVAA